MTPTDPPEPPTVVSAPPPAPRRFLRAHDDRVLGGVAGGLGRAFNVDAIIFRIALAALVFAGGVGLLAYGAALLLVPSDDGTGQPAPRTVTWRKAAVGIALLIGAGLAFWGSAWATAAGGGVLVASIVVALGAALVVAAFRGVKRARWLAVPALVIAFPAGVVSAADISLDGGLGERTSRPTGGDRLPSGYRLGAGELVVDLRDLDWGDGRRVALDLDVGMGHAVVYVPETVCVGARSDIGAGHADVLGRDAAGVDLEHDVAREPTAGAPGLTLDVHIGMGAFEVLHRPDDVGRGIGPGDDFDGHRRRESAERREARRLADRACSEGRS